ncbi:MAG: NADH-quinone oxidoreductase subunit NuoG [Acidiferrobacterales bacterium]|nr:NADH-quinone oxidoreductase subunit NuoG [Acidiferrobacterales bacterium]
MSDSPKLTIEIDGRELEAAPGSMIIEVADAAGIYIPRFCYHEKLSVAANCRMCLVEVERAPKPLPACATPIMDGMKVKTASEYAVDAQKDTLEFLLINHPLDCPICDQGGECPLQDQAVGYGGHLSRFNEKKRVVQDHSIGPLIETEMTRCIHCTRCVRFGEEVAGVMELGITGRGEHLKIDTFFGSAVDSEVSGNVIDLCPVGALTSKPYRFTARSWELISHSAISPHDCVGTNIDIQTLRNEVKRVLPRVNESINECWISDRDRYSYEALEDEGRLGVPMVRKEGELIEVSWREALNAAVEGLSDVIHRHDAAAVGTLVSPMSTFEEFYLAQKLTRSMGSPNIDHRLRQIDFSLDEDALLYPGISIPIDQIPNMETVVLVGSNIRKEQPLLGLRVRKAANKGACVDAISPMDWKFNFPLSSNAVVAPNVMPYALAHVLKAVCEITKADFPTDISDDFLDGAGEFAERDSCAEIASHLCKAQERAVVILGHSVISHPMYSCIERLVWHIGKLSGASVSVLPPANSVAGWIAGCLPHRIENGQVAELTGMNARQMIYNPRPAYVLFNVEPSMDLSDGLHAAEAMDNAEFVVSFQFFSDVPDYVDVALPLAAYTENSGTFINCEGRIQKSTAAVSPYGEARPGWKILRVLGNLMEKEGFDYVSTEEIVDEVAPLEGFCERPMTIDSAKIPCLKKGNGKEAGRFELISDPLIYGVDAVVRRAVSLQNTSDAEASGVGLHPHDMSMLKLDNGDSVTIRSDLHTLHTFAVSDERVAPGCAYFPAGTGFGPSAASGTEIRLERDTVE